MHTCNIWKLFLVPYSQLHKLISYITLYVQLYLNTLISYLYVAVSNILGAVTKYIALKKLGYFNSHTEKNKYSNNKRSDAISYKMLRKTNSGTTFIEVSLWHVG